MTFIVEVRYTGGDWADLLADMRSWLDRLRNSHHAGQDQPF